MTGALQKYMVLAGLSLFTLASSNLQAQENDVPPPRREDPILEERLQQRIESLIEDLEEETDPAELIENLELLRLRPLNLNLASAEDLRRIIFLNNIQINNLIEHRSRFGRLISILELQAVNGFDLETIRQIEPFVTVEERVDTRQMTLRDISERGNSQYFLRYQRLFEEQRGYSDIDPQELEQNPNSRYMGSPYRLYTRYRFTYYNNLSVGFTAEKDPGEEFFRGSQPYGFDYYSAHLYLRDAGRIKSLALGDYQVQFGQGLSLWSGLAFGKSSESINIKKNGLGVRPYTSVDENNFMRGAAATLKAGNFEITAFYSGKHRDANVLEFDTISGDAMIVSSIQQTGLHRTPRELENKNTLQETFWGTNLTWRKNNLQLGTTAYYMELGSDLQRNLSFYNQFDFNQNTNWVAGADYSYVFRNFNVFGEFARSQNGGYAFLNGIMMSLDPRLSMSLLHRQFSPRYQSLLSAAFAEGTRVSNENGIYLGLNSRLSSTLTLNAYADHFSFPWMRFRTYAPTQGYDYLIQLNYRPERRVEMYARYRIRNKPLNSGAENVIRYPQEVKRQNIRLHFIYPVSPSFTFRNRVEWVQFNHGNSKQNGFLIYQDITFRNLSSPWAITTRYALFDTDGYDSRIYAYENDVLYAFSFPFYSYKGHRAYIVARYRINRYTDLQARIAQTIYTNRNEIGSGLELISGNTRTEIKAQLRLRF